MLKEGRQTQIADLLKANGRVEVNHLCRLFKVTEITIRRDLSELEQTGVAVRFHGGALLANDTVLNERPYQLRAVSHLAEKEAIARLALPLLTDGTKVFFDSSTTVLALARLITNDQDLLVVTDTISTALELSTRSAVKVLCIGGELRKATGSCYGYFSEQMLQGMHFDMAFLSVPRVTETGLLCTPTVAELPIKRMAMDRADKVVLLVDHSKFGTPDLLTLGSANDTDYLFTDDKMDPRFIECCKQAGVDVRTVQTETDAEKRQAANKPIG